MPEKKIIIFDGECGLCSRLVVFIIQRDKQETFLFAPLQTEFSSALMQKNGLALLGTDSIVLISDGKAYVRAEAVFEIIKCLDGAWSLLRCLRFLPVSWNDFLYRFVAKNRYRIFGKRSCMVPSEELSSRFLADKK
jgi:predicted DCC family thiol-disulfide oxidoreductase YuxK